MGKQSGVVDTPGPQNLGTHGLVKRVILQALDRELRRRLDFSREQPVDDIPRRDEVLMRHVVDVQRSLKVRREQAIQGVVIRELTARAAEIEDDLSQPSDDDWEEQATESTDDEVLTKVGEVTLDEIRQVKFALAQLDAGTYGVCTKCNGSIAKERLAVLPYATKCVKCSRQPTE